VTLFLSDYIDDFFYNFSIEINVAAISVPIFIKTVEKEMDNIKRRPAFYITPWTEPLDLLVRSLRDCGYQRQFQDQWMFFTKGSQPTTPYKGETDLTVRVVSNESDVENFVKVYSKVYVEEPDDSMYLTALRQSFSPRDVDTFHLIGYKHGQPIAIATLIYADGWGGIYNVGTLTEHRHQGIGSQITQACINKWKELDGHILFLQTEEGVTGEKFYNRLGFKTAFVAECWAR
jgi:GNAT superfamily N-acetyltransferase